MKLRRLRRLSISPIGAFEPRLALEPGDLLLCRLIPLAYGAVLLVLALFKATAYWKLDGLRGSRLVLVLLRDQVFYYSVYVLMYSER